MKGRRIFRITATVRFATAVTLCVLFASTVFAKPFVVVVDPGHGGVDKGATHGDISESHIALSVSKKVHERLSNDSRFRVVLTRTRDTTVTLYQRSQIARSEKADLFVSVHVNSSPEPQAHGTEFYVQSQMPQDEESLFLAHRENSASEEAQQKGPGSEALDVQMILQDLVRPHATVQSHKLAVLAQQVWKVEFPNVPTKIRQGPFFVLQSAVAPSLLVELGYLTHSHEATWLTSSEHQDKLGLALFSAIQKFREIMDKRVSQGHITAHAFGRQNIR